MAKIKWPNPTNSRHAGVPFQGGVAQVERLSVWQRAYFTQVGARIVEDVPMPDLDDLASDEPTEEPDDDALPDGD
ncbi:MAG: hypothetical protein ACTH31_15920 [Pseudoclavibacter sp.]